MDFHGFPWVCTLGVWQRQWTYLSVLKIFPARKFRFFQEKSIFCEILIPGMYTCVAVQPKPLIFTDSLISLIFIDFALIFHWFSLIFNDFHWFWSNSWWLQSASPTAGDRSGTTGHVSHAGGMRGTCPHASVRSGTTQTVIYTDIYRYMEIYQKGHPVNSFK